MSIISFPFGRLQCTLVSTLAVEVLWSLLPQKEPIEFSPGFRFEGESSFDWGNLGMSCQEFTAELDPWHIRDRMNPTLRKTGRMIVKILSGRFCLLLVIGSVSYSLKVIGCTILILVNPFVPRLSLN